MWAGVLIEPEPSLGGTRAPWAGHHPGQEGQGGPMALLSRAEHTCVHLHAGHGKASRPRCRTRTSFLPGARLESWGEKGRGVS